jgi:rubrerythrin
MNQTDFAGALEFALARERAAVAFYSELAAMASFAAQKATLDEFRLMEEGHVAMVKSMQARGRVSLSPEQAVDLGLAKRLAADEPPAAGMTYQQILATAIRKEERSGSLYNELATATLDGDIRTVFERLAAEETRHRHYFEDLYENEVSRDN